MRSLDRLEDTLEDLSPMPPEYPPLLDVAGPLFDRWMLGVPENRSWTYRQRKAVIVRFLSSGIRCDRLDYQRFLDWLKKLHGGKVWEYPLMRNHRGQLRNPDEDDACRDFDFVYDAAG